MRIHQRPPLLALAPLLAVLAGASALALGPLAVDFELKRLDGGKWKLSDHRGEVVLVLFMSDDCGACHEELEAVNAIQDRYREAGLTVVGVLAAAPAPKSRLRDARFALVLANDAVREAYRVIGYPMHYLVGRQFTIQAKHRGWSDGRERILETEIRQVIGGEDINEQGMNLYAAQGSWKGHWVPGTAYRPQTDEVMALLRSEDGTERSWAVKELGRRRSKDAVAMLGSILVGRAEALPLRREALAALQRIDSRDSVGSYLKVARTRGEPELLRRDALFALSAHVATPGVVDLLAQSLSEPDPNVRMAAASVLGERCVSSVRGALEEALAREQNEWVARAMRTALESLAACPLAP